MITTDTPHQQLTVRFYDGTIRSEYKSAQEGREVVDDAVYVEISVPGNNTLQVIDLATPQHKARFPMEWQRYLNGKGDETMGGTPIEELSFLSPAARENLKAMRFYSVEQIAGAGDAEMQRFGMSLGMAGLAVREKAMRYLQFAEKNAGYTQLEREIAERDTKLTALEAQMASMAEMLEKLTAQPEKRGPGRPPKVDQETEAA